MTAEAPPAAIAGHARRELQRPALVSVAAITCAVLAYWAFARTPVEHTSARTHTLIAAGAWVIAATALLLGASAIVCWLDARDERWPAAVIRALPAWAFVLPVSLAASFVAARMAITPDAGADYWPALALWLAATAALLAAVASPLALTVPSPRIRAASIAHALQSELTLVAALTAAALAMRLVALDSVPPLVHVDEEAIGFDAWRAVHGQLPNVFSVGWGANPALGFYIIGGFVKLFGAQIMSVRIASAGWGAAAIPVVYLLLRELFDRPRAVAGSVFLLGYHLHLHFSRVGLNVVWDTPTMAAAMLFAYRASRDGRRFDFAAAGVICGFALYLYHGTRVVPVVVFAYFVYVAAFRWRFAREHAAGLLLAAGAFAAVALPLVVYYLAHQQAFWSRLNDASIFQSGYFDRQRDLGRSAPAILWDQTKHAFGGWVYYRDQSPFVLYPQSSSLVRGLAVIPLIAGIAYAALRIDDRRYALVIIGFAVPTFIGGALTLGPPNAQRLFSAVPSVICLITIGIWQLGRLVLARSRPLLILAAVATAAGLSASDAWTYYRSAHDNTRWGVITPTVAADYIGSLPAGTRVYWFGAPSVTAAFSPLTMRGRHPIEVFDSVPTGVAAVALASPSAYIFLAGQDARLGAVMARCPGGNLRDIAYQGMPILRSYEISRANTCTPPAGPPDTFARAVRLASVPTTDFAVISSATLEAGEPQPACAAASHTIWYEFTPRTDGRVGVTTDGSTLPTVLAAYAGDRLDALSPAACAASGAGPARIDLPLTAGRQYFFQIGALSDATSGVVRTAFGPLVPQP